MTDNPEQNVRTRTKGHIFEVTLDRPKAIWADGSPFQDSRRVWKAARPLSANNSTISNLLSRSGVQ